jgi:hypothetical protein
VYIPGAAFILAAIAFISNKNGKNSRHILLAALLIHFCAYYSSAWILNAVIQKYARVHFINLLKDTAIACFCFAHRRQFIQN